jgi:hypothetical protein
MKCQAEYNFPKKLISTTALYPGIFSDDLTFTFTAEDVNTSDPKEFDTMFFELDSFVAKYKQDLLDHIAKKKS